MVQRNGARPGAGLHVDIEVQRDGFELKVAFGAESEVLVLVGPSGAGKSTTLSAIAGLVTPRAGEISLDGETYFLRRQDGAAVNLPARHRRVGYVFQDYALFPHMNALDNVGYPLWRQPGRERRARSLLESMGMGGFANRYPHELSGGQRQRVAIARALAAEPRVLLMDEPFSALDDTLREAMRSEFLRLRAELGLTILFVTHDLREAHLLADRIGVVDNGRLLQVGRREEVFRRPAGRRVAEMTGASNVMAGTVLGMGEGWVNVDIRGLHLKCALPTGSFTSFTPGQQVDAAIRPERINLRRGAPADTGSANVFEARIVREFSYGPHHILHFEPMGPGPAVEVDIPSRPYEVLGVASHRRWTLELPPEDLHVMHAASPDADPARGPAR